MSDKGLSNSIFLSYRRSDSGGYAGWLHQVLADRFPGDDVFQDIDGIKGGEKWTDQLDIALARTSVVVAVIGPTWLNAANEHGRRLEDPNDRVRRELEAGIERGVPVIPALVGGAKMPPEDALPGKLEGLHEWQAIRLSDDNWREDVKKLADAINRARTTAAGGRARRTKHRIGYFARKHRPLAAATAVVAVAAAPIALPQIFSSGSSCPSTPVSHSDVAIGTPTVTTQQVDKLLSDYASLYSNHDSGGLKDILSPSLCRYSRGQVLSESGSLAEYTRQFDLQAHDPAHPHPTVDYKLTITKRELGVHQARVTADFNVSAPNPNGSTDQMGNGHAIFHIIQRSDGTLAIDQILIT